MLLTFSKASILIINDTKSVIKIIDNWLRNYGFIPVIVDSGKEILDIAKQIQPDLILLNMLRSDFNDIEMCQLLKKNLHTTQIPIILLTEKDNIIEKVKTFAMGGIDYLVKPVQEQELIARITICLHEHQRLSQLQDRLANYEQRYGLLETQIAFPHLKSVSIRELNNIHRVQQYLLEHLGANHSLAELARFAHTNRNKLNHSFQTLLGKSVFDWLREQRLQKSAELLRTTPLQIQEISMSVGYNNHAHFSTQFKQRFQVTPKQYRNQEGE